MRLDDEIRRQAEQVLSEKFPHLNVSLSGVRRIKGRGLAAYELTLSKTSSDPLQSKLLVVDEILLECDADLQHLLQGPPEVRRVVVRRPQLFVARLADGNWNLQSLWPLPECGEQRPEVVVENAQITFVDQLQPELPAVTLRDVNFTLRHEGQSSDDHVVVVDALLEGPHVRHAKLRAKVDLTAQFFALEGSFEQMQLTDELRSWMTVFAGPMVRETTVEGRLDGEFSASHTFSAGKSPEFSIAVNLSNGRLSDRRLHQTVTDLSCRLVGNPLGLKIENLRGNLGSANLALQAEMRGWGQRAPLALGLRLQHVPLNKHLYAALPAILQQEWDKYRPTGVVDAAAQLTYDGHQWQPKVTLTGQQLAFESNKFPYRVNNGTGTMRFTPRANDRPAVLDINVVAYAGAQPVKFVGQAYNPSPGCLGWMEISGSNLEIDARMIGALQGKTRSVIESLHPQGTMNVRWRFDRNQPGQQKPRSSVRLELLKCRVNYDKFPYPLRGIRGLIMAEDGRWTFRDLVSGGSRNVQCQGYLAPTDQGTELSLQFTGQEIPLDDDLKNAVPPAVNKAWDEIRPGGRIDLIADVFHRTGDPKPSIRVSVHPRPETATVHPRFFDYSLDHVDGQINYANGHVTFDPRKGIRARHGRTTVRTKGFADFSADGAWAVQLEGLTVDHLAPQRDLLVALPPKLQKLIDQLRLTGSSFSLHNGLLRFSKASSQIAPVRTEWDIQLSCHQTDLLAGVQLRNVHGAVRLTGESEGAKSFTSGELAIDSATFEGVQFTNIRGPLWADGTRCLLGDWATRQRGLPSRRMTANVYGGSVVADAWVTYDGVPKYSAVASLRNAELRRLVTERFGSRQDFQGKIGANLTLHGQGKSIHALLGQGEVQVTDANILEFPLLLGMLKVLRSETPDTTAFNECDTKFRIQGRHIYFDKLDFLGDAISFLGQGEADFDHNINLSFYSIIGRNQIQLPWIRNFVQQMGQQTVQMSVDGTMSDPVVHTQALPGIKQLIQQVQADLSTGGSSPEGAPRKAERRLFGLPSWGATK